MEPLVTVVVPTIGRSRMLGEMLASLCGQIYSNYEVLILDNASPPDAQEIIQSYVRHETRARILRCEERIPMFENFSRGITAANGKYLTFFHDDDIYLPEFLQRHVSLLEAHPRVGFSGSNCYLIDESGVVIGKRNLTTRDEICAGRKYISRLMRRGVNVFSMSTVMFRRDGLGQDTFDPTMGVWGSDYVILMRVAECHDVGLITAPLVQVRLHNDQATKGVDTYERIRLMTNWLRVYCFEFESRWPNETDFVRKLRKNFVRARRSDFVWGWFNAENSEEGRQCLEELNSGLFDLLVRLILQLFARLGFSPGERRRRILPFLRRIAYVWDRRRD